MKRYGRCVSMTANIIKRDTWTSHDSYSLYKGAESESDEVSRSSCNLQEMQGKEEYAQLYHKHTVSKIQTGKFYR